MKGKDVCFESGITWDHVDLIDIEVSVETGRTCQRKCKDTPLCSAFTWNTDDHPNLPRVCILFNSDTIQLSCTNCISGPPSCVCSSEYACNIVDDNIIDIIAPVYDEEECQSICKDDDICNLYTWFGDGNDLWKSTCMLFQSCHDTDQLCSDCHTGPAICSDATTTTTPFSTTSPVPVSCIQGQTVDFELEHGEWLCNWVPNGRWTCVAECGNGYVTSGRSVTKCNDYGYWTISPESVQCETGVALIHRGDDETSEVFGQDIHFDLPRPSGDDNMVDFDRSWMDMVYFDSKVLICGGGWHTNTRRTCLEMTSSNNTWKSHSNMTTERQGFGLVPFYGDLYAFGDRSHDTFEYTDPWMPNWTLGNQSLPHKHGYDDSCLVKIAQDMIIYSGGACYTGHCALNYVVAYNITTNAFLELPPLIHSRAQHNCVYLDKPDQNLNGVLVTGGSYDDEGIASTEFFDLKTQEWRELGPLKTGRSDAVMAFLGGDLKIMGGNYRDDWTDDYIYLTSVEKFNFATLSWEMTEENLFGTTVGDRLALVPRSLFP